jgi:hypothetical protein
MAWEELDSFRGGWSGKLGLAICPRDTLKDN